MIGWIGSALLVVGMLAIGYGRRWGFLVGFAGECLWTLKALTIGQLDLLIICIVFDFIYLWDYYKWGKANGTDV